MEIVVVKFVTSTAGYNAGEKAGFPPNRAAELIRLKYAVPFAERAVVTKEAEPATQPTVEQPKAPTIEKSSAVSNLFKGKRGKR